MTGQGKQSADDLLKHLPEFGVVICQACKFAIQPQALASHLLRHQIYREERRQTLERFSALGLVEPDNVPVPDPNGPPLPYLPLHQGYICVAMECSHSCVSQKRMFQHWSEVHGEPDSKKVKSRPATLQTFFRGNKIRYFEVNGSHLVTTPEVGSSARTSGDDSPAVLQHFGAHSPNVLDEWAASFDLRPDLDLEALRYFWHYTISPHLIPHRGENGSRRFWTETVYHEAFNHQFLMHGILAVSAAHFAVEAPDGDSCWTHREAAIRYQSAGLATYHQTLKHADVTNSTALIAYARYRSVQTLMLQQIEDKHGIPASYQGSLDDLSSVGDLFSLLRCNIEAALSLQHLLPPGSDLILGDDEARGIRTFDELEVIEESLMHSLHVPPDYYHRLDALPQRLFQLGALRDREELQAVTQAKSALIVCAARSYAAPNLSTLWRGVETFVRSAPDHFVHMLEAHRPAALITFAHWCPMVLRLEGHYFYLQGHAARLLRTIRANVTPELFALIANLEHFG